MSTKWKKDHIEKFIFYVRPHTCLYSLNSMEYLNHNLKAQAFSEILAQMQEYMPNISVDAMKKKLRNLRTQFMHEQRMVQQSKKSGCGSSDVYVPKLWCYDQLSFLKNHGTSKKPAKKIVMNQKIKMEKKWKREHIEHFICLVQQHSCLYDIKTMEYLDETLKAEAFNEILAQMQEYIPNITVEDMERKLRMLRTQYMHEQSMVHDSIESGREGNDIYVPKLWCYDQLSFLNNYDAIGLSEDNMEDSNVPSPSEGIAEQIIEDDICKDEEMPTLSDCENSSSSFRKEFSRAPTPPRKRTSKNSDQMDFLKDIESFQNSILSQRKMSKKFEWLGNLVTAQMDEIDPEEQEDAAWTVQCLMRELTSHAARKSNTPASSPASCKNLVEVSMDEVYD